MKITKDMVGLEIHSVKGTHTNEFNEYTVNIILKEISDEGLELFGLTEDDCK